MDFVCEHVPKKRGKMITLLPKGKFTLHFTKKTGSMIWLKLQLNLSVV